MIQLLQSLDMHTHRFKGITSTERLHYHNFHDVTYLAPNVRQHHHAYYTYTTQDFNHKHLMLGITGPALYRQDGSHTHRLQSLTSINGGKPHYHEFRVITSRHYVPHITPPPIGPPSKPPKPTQPIAPPSKPVKPPKPTQPIAPPSKPVKPPKPTQPIAPPSKPVKPPKPTQPIAPPSKPVKPKNLRNQSHHHLNHLNPQNLRNQSHHRLNQLNHQSLRTQSNLQNQYN
ncbi:hypothetical protein KHQ82_03490 [Mycoplasmatota bacterium]|nr:hypothetical protein KHQ82_03490 [Mycoplasmatota bacterium]